MTENRMYSQRVKNIPVMRYCGFDCVYCAFQKFQKISACEKCRAGEKHSHMEVLQRTPPKTKEGEFLTVGLSGDVSFMPPEAFYQVIEYCRKWKDRTFLIQSKDPEYFLPYRSGISQVAIPRNVILGTTIESNYTTFRNQDYDAGEHNPREFTTYKKCGTGRFKHISEAPLLQNRYAAMLKLTCRKAVTIEPVLSHDTDILVKWVKDINPELCWIGYDNHNHKLPEPPLEKTLELIAKLRDVGIDVRGKTLRLAWYEGI